MLKNYTVKELAIQDLSQALNLVWDVFLEFEAPDYCEEGVQEFKKFIECNSIRDKLLQSQFNIWACYDNNKIIGVLATRPPCHISLLFVDKQYHRKGIARAMFNEMLTHYKTNSNYSEIMVNSSPYAAEVYHRLGFKDTNTEQTVNGIRFIPMKRLLQL